MANNRRQTRKKGTEQTTRRMSFITTSHNDGWLTWCDVGQVIQIDVLPDDVLLEIFDFYMIMDLGYEDETYGTETEGWHSLVHVCRRWRNLVFGSPRRLNLRLYCTPETPARDRLDVWPALPLIVYSEEIVDAGMDNIIAALGQSDRICEATLLYLADRQLEEVLAAMQVPFPELTELCLSSRHGTPPVIPDSFLGGSSPHLRSLELSGIPFPGLPKFLLSANQLVTLLLSNIPHSGYISPEAMVALLCALSSLRSLILRFQSPESRPDRESRSLPSSKRSIVPALHEFHFEGVVEYLEELVNGIDTPQLDKMNITFFGQMDFDCPRLVQFINRTPTPRALDEARVEFKDRTASVRLGYRRYTFRPYSLLISISCGEPNWQLSAIEQVCNSALHHLSTVEHLYIEHRYQYSELDWEDGAIESTLWLRLFLPFTAVKNLYLSVDFEPAIMATLEGLDGGRTAEGEILPNLQNIFVV
jgi:hypothetical protein